jgi:N-methylhydantoinase A/oxoprolinase/acetone carboxylase beta subunit
MCFIIYQPFGLVNPLGDPMRVSLDVGGVTEYPIKLPMVDLKTIGAGGGSIAWECAQEGGIRCG